MHLLRASLILFILLPGCATDDEDDLDGKVATSEEALKYRDPGDDPPEPIDCDDGNPCTVDWVMGTRCRHRNEWDGTSCEDGNLCNGEESCSAGMCIGATTPACDDGDVCTDDACDPAIGCTYTDNTAPCSDGNACTVGDRCSAGVCDGLGSENGQIVAPYIADVVISAPGGVLERTPNLYLAGDELDVAFTVPSCTYVTGVELGTRILTTAPRTQCGEFDPPGQCEPNFYTIDADQYLPDGSRRLRLRLHLTPSLRDGSSAPVRITVASALGIVTLDRVLSRVAEVQPAWLGLSISQADLHNGFVSGFFEGVGDDGRQPMCAEDPNNPNRLCEDDPSIPLCECPTNPTSTSTTLYDVDYNQTSVQIDENGLRIRSRFKATAPYWCDALVNIDARYILFSQGSSVVAQRVPEQTTITFDWPGDIPYVPDLPDWLEQCNWLPGSFIVAIVAGISEGNIIKALDEKVTEQTGDVVSMLCGGLCQTFLLSTAPGEIRIQVPRIAGLDAIGVDVDYKPSDARYPSPYGVPVRAGEKVVVAAKDLVQGCDAQVGPNDPCFGVMMGPTGVPNWWNDATMPIPETPSSVERWEARGELKFLWRSSTSLPRPGDPIGVVLGKLASAGSAATPRRVATGPCAFDVPTTGPDLLGLGPNDVSLTNGKVTGKGTRRVSLIFAPANVPVPPCVP